MATTKQRTYPAIGRCIYCGADGHSVPLKEEHIIPYGAGGRLKLPDSSCAACEKITGAIEGHCLGRMFGNARAHLGIRSRHRKKENKSPVELDFGTHTEIRMVDIEDQPAILFMFRFGIPDILAGLDPIETFGGKAVVRPLTPDLAERVRKFGAKGMTLSKPMDSFLFARMLAKIAHSFAIGEYGVNGFRPFLNSLILGIPPVTPGYFVGSSLIKESPSQELHELSLDTYRRHDGQIFLTARIRLFANQEMPTHHVVVGQLHSATKADGP